MAVMLMMMVMMVMMTIIMMFIIFIGLHALVGSASFGFEARSVDSAASNKSEASVLNCETSEALEFQSCRRQQRNSEIFRSSGFKRQSSEASELQSSGVSRASRFSSEAPKNQGTPSIIFSCYVRIFCISLLPFFFPYEYW